MADSNDENPATENDSTRDEETDTRNCGHERSDKRWARSGNLPYVILGLVGHRAEGVHGYQLKQELECICDDARDVNYGRLYDTLDSLARSGHLQLSECIQRNRPTRKVYQMTCAGQQLLEEWLLLPVSDNPRPLRDELSLKMLFLDRSKSHALSRHVERQRGLCLTRLARIARRRKRLERAMLDPAAVDALLEAPEMRLHADLAWLKRVESRIVSLS